MVKTLNAKGVTLIELMVAMTILSVVALSVISTRYYMAKKSLVNNDKAYATQKAIQMMEELKALVAGSEQNAGGIGVLDDYADGSTAYNTLLTTDRNVTSPADPLSGNRTLTGGGWRFLRNISIQHVANDPQARQVFIRVFKSADANPSLPEADLADVGGMLRTVASPNSPSQVFDLYVLALSNVPGWWDQVPKLQSDLKGVIGVLQQLNPGLILRTHYITRTAFGRDLQYAPYINKSSTTNTTAMPWIYFYPGNLTDSNGSDEFYDPAQMSDLGRVNVDGTVNSSNYSICDMYNHAVRYPDEVSLYNQALTAGGPPPEPSLRMLLEEMNSAPQSFTNAMIVNLHGELLPMPAMRNYSDAAKDPANASGVGGQHIRVVTHPENLHWRTGSPVTLRVYAYYDGMDGGSTPASLDPTGTSAVSQITLLFPNETGLGSGNVTVTAVVGNSSVTYNSAPLPSGVASMGMSWAWGVTTINGSNDFYMTLYNTPLRCPPGSAGRGLATSNWLYGLEYIPCPVVGGSGEVFSSRDLTSNSTGPKNTARWIITINKSGAQVLSDNSDSNHPYTVETRIGNDFNSGTLTDNPPDLSRTYFWMGDAVPPPITEQYQFLGDPRHCPYLDVKNGNTRDPISIGPDGYNWYFTSIPSGYSGFGQAVTGWGTEGNAIDVPRYYQIFRNAILNTQAIWTTMNGYSYYYYGLGGEFGGNQPPFPNGVTFVQGPWVPGSTTVKTVDEILTQSWATAQIQNARIVMNTGKNWYAKYWLGELYPDSKYSQWATIGNLPTGTGNFYREQYNSANLTGTNWSGPTRKLGTSTAGEGCAAFLNGISSGSKFFQHDGGPNNTQNATIQQLAVNLQPLFTIPLTNPVSCTRPWCIDYGGGNPKPTEWNNTVYSSQRTTLSIPSIATPGPTPVSRIFYNSDDSNSGGTWQGSGVVKLALGSETAFVVESGLSIQTNIGPTELGEIALMELLRTYMDGGLYSSSSHIPQVPLVTLTAPKTTTQLIQPASIGVTWAPTWQRWGANPYTEEYAPITYSEPATLVGLQYNLKYSTNQGSNWYFVQDNTSAVTGVYDASHAVTATNYSWDVSDTTQFPQGDYSLRVEAYRENMAVTQMYPLHYSFHQEDNLFISR